MKNRSICCDIDAVISLIEVLEINAMGNDHIRKLQENCHNELKNLLEGTDKDWIIATMLELRKDLKEELCI